jgi:hypothetical protein
MGKIDTRRWVKANAADRVEARFRARRKLAATAPKASLLPFGSAEQVLDLIRYYECPIAIPGGHYTGVRLYFARMSDDESSWVAVGGVTLYRCGEVFFLQPVDQSIAPLQLSFDGDLVRRVRVPWQTRRVAEPRSLGSRGTRLA